MFSITCSAYDMGAMMGGSGVSVNITGEDYTTLKMIADDLTAQIAAIPGAVDVSSTVAEQVPQVKVTADRQACSQYGLTAYSVAAAVRSGLTETTATTVTIDNKEVDVVVRGDGRAEESADPQRSTHARYSRCYPSASPHNASLRLSSGSTCLKSCIYR